MLHAVIMAGGAGTRFWPASRMNWPKQLLDLTGDGSMLQNTVARLEGVCTSDEIVVMTNHRLVDAIREQLPELPKAAIVGEPCKRDTAPCVGWAAQIVQHKDPNGTMVVLPADHVIGPKEKFQQAIRYALELVEENPKRIVTFGIRPSYPAETFGYIERADPLPSRHGMTAATVRCFREKPNAEQAAEYLATGQFYWNSGIFIWKAQTIFNALQEFEPTMAGHLQAIGEAIGSAEQQTVLEREFAAIEGTSIDYAVMERYQEEICVIEAPFDWDDLGGWQASARLLGADDDGNTRVGRTIAIDTSNTIIRTDDQHVVAALGMKNCIIVHTPNATLVANKNDEESIREVVKQLKEMGWHEYL